MHWFPATWYDWHQAPPELAKAHDVIAIDLPRPGESGTPTADFSHTRQARRIAAGMAGLGVARHDVVSHDMGNWILFPYGRNHGELVDKVVVMEAGLAGFGLEDAFIRQRTWHFSFHAGDPAPAAGMLVGREAFYLDRFYDKFAVKSDAISDALRQEFRRAYSKPGALEAAFRYYEEIRPAVEADTSLSAKLPQPALAIGGQYAAGPSEDSWSQVYSDLTVKLIQGIGHYPLEEATEETVSAILAFLTPTAL